MKLPMDSIAIQQCIPHRPPFLLVDRVLEVVPNERIVATKVVSNSEPVLAGHFPGNPVLPGVYILEAVAQAAAVLGHLSSDKGLSQCLLTEVSSARFRRPVVPGDTLRMDIKVARFRAPFFWFEASCTVDGDSVAELKLSAFIK